MTYSLLPKDHESHVMNKNVYIGLSSLTKWFEVLEKD
jgi:hypothetical protein